MVTVYNGLKFDTELEAIWASFFDLAGWQWWYNPVSIDNWQPDFKVTFPCSHSECGGSHTLLVSVVATDDIKSMSKHPSLSHSFEVRDEQQKIVADGGALLGLSPSISKWEIAHGSGGGLEDIFFRVQNANELWQKAVASIK
ncbi:TPA: hypothetical protein GRI96_23975 [Vibrio parahaemolyticus]|uniref:hypothetical protein n=1 Tax=Vibrio parahaemolyticus TaxID=670 RepID=UPI000B920972|nr:hypothetical protein [Vibrio parahaemolyticus]EII3443232.1 hypothetical protein [Vibrio parahaemolyticus]ELA7843028.1 hypothetical protein [Vibrio parahaemolyticus]OXD26735.1 hypothetical protein CA164_23040 [Vibrio parahaemolyticus]RPB31405.1 hypothetical protein CYQ90_24140 [Vibrio parahaemolyticus]HAS6809212.1 hypothetical protein [Vibrio parahaemolyticus]